LPGLERYRYAAVWAVFPAIKTVIFQLSGDLSGASAA